MLEEREAFLRAIFDDPDDDTPRLVFADWLEEHGEEIAAKAIRLSIEIAHVQTAEELESLRAELHELRLQWRQMDAELRGLRRDDQQNASATFTSEFTLPVERFANPRELRESLVRQPWSFGCRSLTITGTRLSDSRTFDVLFSLQAFQQVRDLGICGHVEVIPAYNVSESGEVLGSSYGEYRSVPLLTLSGVEALANHRGCRRLLHLDLRNNNLGNDAIRFLAKSPYLLNLKRLDVAEGNNFRGRVWQLLIERFGEDVVS